MRMRDYIIFKPVPVHINTQATTSALTCTATLEINGWSQVSDMIESLQSRTYGLSSMSSSNASAILQEHLAIRKTMKHKQGP